MQEIKQLTSIMMSNWFEERYQHIEPELEHEIWSLLNFDMFEEMELVQAPILVQTKQGIEE